MELFASPRFSKPFGGPQEKKKRGKVGKKRSGVAQGIVINSGGEARSHLSGFGNSEMQLGCITCPIRGG